VYRAALRPRRQRRRARLYSSNPCRNIAPFVATVRIMRRAIGRSSGTGRCNSYFPPDPRNPHRSTGSHDQTSANAERAFLRRTVRLCTHGDELLPTATKRLTGMIGYASLGPPTLPFLVVLLGRQVGVASSTVGLPIVPGMPAMGKRSQPQSLCLAACRPVSSCLRVAASNPTDLPWRGRPGILTAIHGQMISVLTCGGP
jgi:hypothetical protein